MTYTPEKGSVYIGGYFYITILRVKTSTSICNKKEFNQYFLFFNTGASNKLLLHKNNSVILSIEWGKKSTPDRSLSERLNHC